MQRTNNVPTTGKPTTSTQRAAGWHFESRFERRWTIAPGVLQRNGWCSLWPPHKNTQAQREEPSPTMTTLLLSPLSATTGRMAQRQQRLPTLPHHLVEPPTFEPWRKYGAARRQELLARHHPDLPVLRVDKMVNVLEYLHLVERVLSQFQNLYLEEQLEDCYVVGYRMVEFLSITLKDHPDYRVIHSDVQLHLQETRSILKKIAFSIDEMTLNTFMERDFDPQLDDSDDEENDGDDNTNWEPFEGWSFDLPELTADTDESSQDIDDHELVGDPELVVLSSSDEPDEEEDEPVYREAPVLADRSILYQLAIDSVPEESWEEDEEDKTPPSQSNTRWATMTL